MHELIHALYDIYGLPQGKMGEEQIACQLGAAMAALHASAPELLAIVHLAIAHGKPMVTSKDIIDHPHEQ